MLIRVLMIWAAIAFISVKPADARPRGCPHLWCGCYLAIKYGYSGAQARALWLARNWALMFPRTSLAPGTVAVFSRGRRGGHVGEVVDVRPGQVLLHSGNDGRVVRTRWRSTRGLIAVVSIHGGIRHAAAAPAKKYAKRRGTATVRATVKPSEQYLAHAAL